MVMSRCMVFLISGVLLSVLLCRVSGIPVVSGDNASAGAAAGASKNYGYGDGAATAGSSSARRHGDTAAAAAAAAAAANSAAGDVYDGYGSVASSAPAGSTAAFGHHAMKRSGHHRDHDHGSQQKDNNNNNDNNSTTMSDLPPASYPLHAQERQPTPLVSKTTIIPADEGVPNEEGQEQEQKDQDHGEDALDRPLPAATMDHGPAIRPGILTTCEAEHQFALTFDDGPFEYTSALIDLLIKEQVKATFFINGKNYWSGDKINPDLAKAYLAGSEIASHTFTHPHLPSLSHDQIKKEMIDNEKAIFEAIGEYPAVMRPPYGDVNDDNVKYLNSLNYTVVTWSIDINDYQKGTKIDDEMSVVQKALKDSKNHNIILQHDVYKQTASVFAPKVIEFVKSQQLEFVTMSECLGVDAYKPYPIPS